MRLSFRRRLFVVIVGLGTIPLAAALLVLALQVRSSASPTGPRAALDQIAASGHDLVSALDSAALSDSARGALHRHTEVIAERTRLAGRAEMITRVAAGVTGLLILVGAVGIIAASLGLARRWAREVSEPIEELVEWTRRIARGDEPPPTRNVRGPPEFDDLRTALRETATALALARRRELEQERLTAFRETARKVAHEMRGPLNAAQLALVRLGAGETDTTVAVLSDEIARLAAIAREFAEFGRLPEGPSALLDVAELVRGVTDAIVPAAVPLAIEVEPGLTVDGHYEPLRRAIQNLVQNALEAAPGAPLEVRAAGTDASTVRLSIADRGPGVPPSERDRIFEPYVTTKQQGTGLGLALVRQTVTAHAGTIDIAETPGGGATFVLTLPRSR
jgi:signal transduction histidine kinase